MFESKYSNFLTVLLVIIIVAVVGLLGYIGYNIYKSYYIKRGASEYVDAFVGEIEEEDKNTTIESNQNVVNQEAENTTIAEQENTVISSGTTSSTTQKKTQYNGFDVIGTIEISAINLKYPVLEDLSVKSLNTSVVAIFPKNPTLNSVGNVVIAGHNYRNGTFFSNNKKLQIGDKITITGLDGKKVTYIIYNIFEASSTDTSFYNRDTNGAREITLSTCTDASDDMRLIIEAKEQ